MESASESENEYGEYYSTDEEIDADVEKTPQYWRELAAWKVTQLVTESIPHHQYLVRVAERWVVSGDPSELLATGFWHKHNLPADPKVFLEQMRKTVANLERCLAENRVASTRYSPEEVADGVACLSVS